MEPKIRLKGFQGEWVKAPFSEIVNRASASASSLNFPGVEFEDINSGEGTLNKDVSRKKTIKTGKIFAEGDVLFGKLRPYLKNILLAKFKGVAIGDFWVLRPQNVTSELLYILVNSREFMRIANISSGSKMPRADWNLVSSTSFAYPSNKKEQNAIGAYFHYLESLIQSTTKKIESLKQVKAASLQSMFPQEGEATPRVRFKGFEGVWEMKKFDELYEPSSVKNKVYGADKIISVANMYFKPVSYISDDDYLKSYNIMCLGDIAFEGNKSKNFAHGRFVENTIGDGIVSHVFVVLKPKSERYDLQFWKYLINYERIMGPILLRSTKHSTMMTDLVVADFLNESILVPSYEEQQKIGAFFEGLDSQITLHTQRLEKLKQIKSACLDNMFV